MKDLSIDFCITVLVRSRGTHEVVRKFARSYCKDNDIVSFEELDESAGAPRWIRRHFPVSDVLSIAPRVFGYDNGVRVDKVYVLNVESSYSGSSDLSSIAAEPEEEYGYNNNNEY